jgi:hypothetical protein
MRKRNGSLRLTATMCGAAGIGLVSSLLIALAIGAAAPADRVNAAYAAMGGDKLKAISLRASLEQFDPGESYSLSDPTKPDTGVSDVAQSRDLVHGLTRNEWIRPLPDGVTKRIYTEIITPVAGYVVGSDAAAGRLPKRTNKATPPEHTMSGRRLTATLRELERPIVVIEMKQHPDRVSAIADQTVAGKTYPALQYRDDYGTFIVMFDPATNLPARVRTLDWDGIEGDSVYDAEYSDWRDVDGAKIAYHALYTLNGMKIGELKLSSAMINPAPDPASFNIPETMLASAARPAPANVTPFQWIIRRQYLGFYYDSDAMYTDDTDTLRRLAQHALHRDEQLSDRGGSAQRRRPGDSIHRNGQKEISGETDSLPDSHPSPRRSCERHAHLRRRGSHDRGGQRRWRLFPQSAGAAGNAEPVCAQDGLHCKSDRS